MHDQVVYHTHWVIRKYHDDAAFMAETPMDISEVDGNLLLAEGIGEFLKLLTGVAATPFNQANAFLGVGDSAAAETAAQTGLQASTNKAYVACSAGYPTIAGNVVTWRGVFGGTVANFAWNELTVANGNSDVAINLNRKVTAQGTKTTGQTWTLDLQITWS